MGALKFSVNPPGMNKRGGAFNSFRPRSRFALFQAALACFLLPFAAGAYSQSFTEFGLAGDLAVLGRLGTAVDPNVKIKGFTVFGSTRPFYPGLVPGDGNVVISGSVSVSSGAYFASTSTFAGAGAIFINDGSAGQILVKAAGGNLAWKDGSAVTQAADWSPFPFAPGFSDYGGGWQTVQYRKTGDIVYLRGAVSKTSPFAAGDVLGALPEGFRPPAQVGFVCFAPGGSAAISVIADPDGRISVADTIIGHSAPERTRADLSAVQFSITP